MKIDDTFRYLIISLKPKTVEEKLEATNGDYLPLIPEETFGVYMFSFPWKRETLYVGEANNLKFRLRAHFAKRSKTSIRNIYQRNRTELLIEIVTGPLFIDQGLRMAYEKYWIALNRPKLNRQTEYDLVKIKDELDNAFIQAKQNIRDCIIGDRTIV